jgi:hypothetical protein
MTRQWTIEELDRVHPLRDGWSWDVAFGAPPVARYGTGIGSLAVYVDDGELVSEKMLPPTGERFECMFGCKAANEGTSHEPPPADITLAVILASKGLDSREAMAAEVERESARLVPATADATAHCWAGYGRDGLRRVAAMLRRGTVRP